MGIRNLLVFAVSLTALAGCATSVRRPAGESGVDQTKEITLWYTNISLASRAHGTLICSEKPGVSRFEGSDNAAGGNNTVTAYFPDMEGCERIYNCPEISYQTGDWALNGPNIAIDEHHSVFIAQCSPKKLPGTK